MRRDPRPGLPCSSSRRCRPSASRRTAAAGLFSSCASPAASVPSADIFSRCSVNSRRLANAIGHRPTRAAGRARGSAAASRGSVLGNPQNAQRPAPRTAGAGVVQHARERQQARDFTGVLHERGHQLAADPDQQLERTFKDHEHAVGGIPVTEDRLTGLELQQVAVAGQPRELIVGQAAEHLDAAQFLGSELFTASPRPDSTSPTASPGSIDLTIGWLVGGSASVACLLGELSQQPTWPHVMQIRRCTQAAPIRRQSSQPWALGCTPRFRSRGRRPPVAFSVIVLAGSMSFRRSRAHGACLLVIGLRPAPRSRRAGGPPHSARSPPAQPRTSGARRQTAARCPRSLPR